MSEEYVTIAPEQFVERQRAWGLPRLARTREIGENARGAWEVEAETYRPQTNHPRKGPRHPAPAVAIEGAPLHRGMGAQPGSVEYRFGYYTVARNGRWWWGQSVLLIPPGDLSPLFDQAKAEGTIQ